jgi:hypothetical protein
MKNVGGAMTQINPFVGSILQSTAVQRAQAAEKNGHVQRAQVRAKDSASTADQFEHQVESSEALAQVRGEDRQHPQKRNAKKPPKKQIDPASDAPDEGDAPPHIDLKV